MNTESNAAATPENEPMPPQPELQVVPPPEPAAEPEPGKKEKRGPLNKKQAAQVTKAELLIPECREAGAQGPMEDRGIDEAFLVALEGKIQAARANSNAAVFCTVNGKGFTIDEAEAKKALLKALRDFQGAARLKYKRTDPNHLASYLIGQRIGDSRAVLEQSGSTIINKTNTDRPAPVDTSMITAAEVKLQDYKDAKVTQRDEKALASAARVARNQLVEQIIADRQAIQMAADNAWPYTNPSNKKMRMKFGLPAKQPYTA